MTNRIKGLTVTLESDIRDDDAQPIIDAIKTLRGVIGVEAHIADYNHHFAVQVAKQEMRKKIWSIFKEFEGTVINSPPFSGRAESSLSQTNGVETKSNGCEGCKPSFSGCGECVGD